VTQGSLPNDNAVFEDSNVYHGHIGYIPCPNEADGLTEGEFNARLEEWAFQVPRDFPATVAGWTVDASRVLTRSGVRASDNNAREETPLQSQQPSMGSYSHIQDPLVVGYPQARLNVPAYHSDNIWTAPNPEVFESSLQATTPRAMAEPNVMVPANDAVHLTHADIPQQPPAPQQRAREHRNKLDLFPSSASGLTRMPRVACLHKSSTGPLSCLLFTKLQRIDLRLLWQSRPQILQQ
jgi:hypothetical protein